MKTTNCNLIKDNVFDVYCGRGKGIKNNPSNCKVGEAGWLGNPVAIGKPCPECSEVHKKGGDTLICYEKYLRRRLEEPQFKEAFMTLKGKKLACFCKPYPCHTDIMIKLLDQ